jgi:hypothetical protein
MAYQSIDTTSSSFSSLISFFSCKLGGGAEGNVYGYKEQQAHSQDFTSATRKAEAGRPFLETLAVKHATRIWHTSPQWLLVEKRESRTKKQHINASLFDSDYKAHWKKVTDVVSDAPPPQNALWIQMGPCGSLDLTAIRQGNCVPLHTCTQSGKDSEKQTSSVYSVCLLYDYEEACTYKRQKEWLYAGSSRAPPQQNQEIVRGPYLHGLMCVIHADDKYDDDLKGETFTNKTEKKDTVSQRACCWRLVPQLLDPYVGQVLRYTNVFATTTTFIRIHDERRCTSGAYASSHTMMTSLEDVMRKNADPDKRGSAAADWDQFILMERVYGPTLLEYCHKWSAAEPGSSLSREDECWSIHQMWCNIVLQVLCGIAVAQRQCGYKHHDLTIQNVFMRFRPPDRTFERPKEEGTRRVTLGVKFEGLLYAVEDVPAYQCIAIADHGFASVFYGAEQKDRVGRNDIEYYHSQNYMGPWSTELEGWEGYDIQTFLASIFLFGGLKAPFVDSTYSENAAYVRSVWRQLAEKYMAICPKYCTCMARPCSRDQVSCLRPQWGLKYLLRIHPKVHQVTSQRWVYLQETTYFMQCGTINS